MDPPQFQWSDLRFLNNEAEIDKTRRNLPHWQQDGKTYFITFRLKDSIPADILRKWKSDRETWLSHHPKPWPPSTEVEYHRIFSAAIDRHLDQGMGSCILRHLEFHALVSRSFQHFDGDRYTLHSSVVMPNHVHLLLSLKEGTTLVPLIATWKRFTASAINRITNQSGALWMEDHFDRLIRDWDHFINVCRYIRNNPAKAELPPGQYAYYSATWVDKLLG